jgi:hypothetical protein
MNIVERLHKLFPDVYRVELDQWITAGRDYANRLDKLPPAEREAVAQLFASYGLSRSRDDKRAYRAGIDAVIAPWYKGAGHVSAP